MGLETVDRVGLGDRTSRRPPLPILEARSVPGNSGPDGWLGPACWGSAGTCCLGQPRCSRERARGQGGPQDARCCPPGRADERTAGAWGLRQPLCHGPRPGRSDHVLSSPHRPQAQVQSQVRGPTAGLPDERLGGGPPGPGWGQSLGNPNSVPYPARAMASRSLGLPRPGPPRALGPAPWRPPGLPARPCLLLSKCRRPTPTTRHAPRPPSGCLGGGSSGCVRGTPSL